MKALCPIVLAALLVSCDKPAPQATPLPATPAPAAGSSVPQAAAAPASGTPAVTAPAGQVSALGLTFAVPEGWQVRPPANQMRLAELHLPDASGDSSKSCIAVFSTAGGDVQANIDRWAGQVRDAAGQPSTPTITQRTVSGMPVHIAEMTGRFSPGMGDTKVYDNWMMRGAIIESPRGLLFIKMTGPAEAMSAAAGAFNQLIDTLRA